MQACKTPEFTVRSRFLCGPQTPGSTPTHLSGESPGLLTLLPKGSKPR